jgi:hypothetical protein
MGYRFNWQTFLSFFSPNFLLFGLELKLLASIWQDVMAMINMDDFNMWIYACEQWTILFRHVMPMAMENMAIA